jgi:hypothetical protein
VQLSAVVAGKLLPFVTLFGAWQSQALAAIPSEQALPTIRSVWVSALKLILYFELNRGTVHASIASPSLLSRPAQDDFSRRNKWPHRSASVPPPLLRSSSEIQMRLPKKSRSETENNVLTCCENLRRSGCHRVNFSRLLTAQHDHTFQSRSSRALYPIPTSPLRFKSMPRFDLAHDFIRQKMRDLNGFSILSTGS